MKHIFALELECQYWRLTLHSLISFHVETSHLHLICMQTEIVLCCKHFKVYLIQFMQNDMHFL